MRSSLGALAAVLAAPAFLVASAAPASATTSVMYSTACGSSGTQTCFGAARALPDTGSGAAVEVVCGVAAVAFHDARVQCYIEGRGGDVHYTPEAVTAGSAAVLTHRFPASVLTSDAYRVCVGGGFYTDWGYHNAPAGFVCGVYGPYLPPVG